MYRRDLEKYSNMYTNVCILWHVGQPITRCYNMSIMGRWFSCKRLNGCSWIERNTTEKQKNEKCHGLWYGCGKINTCNTERHSQSETKCGIYDITLSKLTQSKLINTLTWKWKQIINKGSEKLVRQPWTFDIYTKTAKNVFWDGLRQ